MDVSAQLEWTDLCHSSAFLQNMDMALDKAPCLVLKNVDALSSAIKCNAVFIVSSSTCLFVPYRSSDPKFCLDHLFAR